MGYRSQLDSERFGVAIGRASLSATDQLPALLDACLAEALDMVIIRASAASAGLAQLAEAAGARLCDTLVYYTRSLDGVQSRRVGPRVRPATRGDADAVAAVAAVGFRDYIGHYHADLRLDAHAADEGYVDWARRTIEVPGVADRVWVADIDGTSAGFLSLKVNNGSETEILLNAVDPRYQGEGIYSALLNTAMVASQEMGAKRIRVSTQLVNYRVQRIWVRSGFEPTAAFHTFHLWMDEVRSAGR